MLVLSKDEIIEVVEDVIEKTTIMSKIPNNHSKILNEIAVNCKVIKENLERIFDDCKDH